MNNQMNDTDDILLSRFLGKMVLPMPSGDLIHRIMGVPYNTPVQDKPALPRGSYLMFAIAALAGIGAGLVTTQGLSGSGAEYAFYDTHPYMVSAASMLSKIFYM